MCFKNYFSFIQHIVKFLYSTHRYIYTEKRRVPEALDINMLQTRNEKEKAIKSLNRGSSDYVSCNTLEHLFTKIGKH